MADSKRRFNIKPFRTHVPMDRTVANDIWKILANAIDEIYNRNASQLSFEELYRNAYNLVLHKHGTLLYDGVSEKLSSHLVDTVLKLADISESQLLEEMASIWNEHQITMVMIHDILMYMDRTYVQQQRRKPVYQLGLHLFRTTVWEHPLIQVRVTDLLMAAISKERSGLLTDDRTLLKANLSMLLELGRADYSNVYERDFESIFLGTTQEFYRLESLNYLSCNSATDYVTKASTRIEEEKERSKALAFPITTEAPLLGIVETELIERHARTLVDMENSGFAALLKDDTKYNEMRDMYDLFVRVPSSVDNLRDALADRIKTDGRLLIADQEKGAADPPAFVRGVLAMRQRYDQIVTISFRGEKKAHKRMKESFEDFLNRDARAASCLAVYVDDLLRIGLKGASEDQVAQELQKVIIVFRYLSDKDVFESFYKQNLAKRLLGNRSVSEDAERAMVSQLKAECGYQFTSKLEGMFNDMRISRDMREAYAAYKRSLPPPPPQQQNIAETAPPFAQPNSNQKTGESSATSNQNTTDNNASTTKNLRPIDIEVDVLTNGYWPSQNVPPCTLPPIVQNAIDTFSKFYLEKHTGRKLSWQTSAGDAELRATFGRAPKFAKYELCVSTYQMCILLLFNTQDTWNFGQIRQRTHIPDFELKRHLISLSTPKHRILRKGSKGRGILSDEDTFTFNVDYTSRLKRVRVSLIKENSVMGRGAAAVPPDDGSGTAAAHAMIHAHGAVGQPGDASQPAIIGGAHVSNVAHAAVGGRIVSGGSMMGTGSHMVGIDGSIPLPVEEDRRHLVEAGIVRIMKARKVLHHNDLIAEVTKQLSVRFNPSPQFIKKRVESLIEREYLERTNEDRRVYNYVA